MSFAISTASFSQATSIFKVDFGVATPNDFIVKSVASPYASIGVGYEAYDGKSTWKYGSYTYINNTDALRAYHNGSDEFKTWVVPGLADHTPGDVDGRMLLVDGKQQPGIVYQTNVVGLCRDTYFDFSAWVANIHATFDASGNNPQMQMEVWSKNPKFEENEFTTTYETAAKQTTFCKGLPDGFVSANGAVLLTKGYRAISGAPAYSNATLQANDDVYIYETSAPGTSNAQERRYKVFKGSDGKYYCTADGKFYYGVTYSNKNDIGNADTKRTTTTFTRDNSFQYLAPEYFTVQTHWNTSNGLPIYTDATGRYFAYKKNGIFYQLASASCSINGTTYYYPEFDFDKVTNGGNDSYIRSADKVRLNGLITSIRYAYLRDGKLYFANRPNLLSNSYQNSSPRWENETSYVLPSLNSTFTYKDDGNTVGRWEQMMLRFKLTNQSNAYLIIRNFNDNSSGNDFVLDDIEFSPVSQYSVSMNMTQAMKEVEGYCSTGEVELTSEISVTPFGSSSELTNEEREAFAQELPTYVFFFEGQKGGEWVRLNESPIKIAGDARQVDYVMPVDDYMQYSSVRCAAYPSIFSATEGCRLNSALETNPADMVVPDAPVVTLETSDICPESVDKRATITVKNTNFSDSQRWSAKVILSDGTVVNVAE
ncbi:MAG: hypothetical protein ILP23_02485 [Paludibacteraceae bacterium]|nr:hypothetical protein [Paludibacteraceae bacterium]